METTVRLGLFRIEPGMMDIQLSGLMYKNSGIRKKRENMTGMFYRYPIVNIIWEYFDFHCLQNIQPLHYLVMSSNIPAKQQIDHMKFH